LLTEIPFCCFLLLQS